MYEEIQLYLDKQLSALEEADFEKRLEVDSDLRKALEVTLAAQASIAITGKEKRKMEFRARYQETKTVEAPKKRIWMYGIAAAAAALLFCVIWLPRVWAPQSPDSETLFASHYEAPTFSGLRNGSNQEAYSIWRKAAEDYNNQQFQTAIPAFRTLLQDTTFEEIPKANYFLGLSYLELDSTKQAIEYFDAVASGSAFDYPSKWYSALAYVKQNDFASAEALLADLVTAPQGFKKKQAEKLLQAIHE